MSLLFFFNYQHNVEAQGKKSTAKEGLHKAGQ